MSSADCPAYVHPFSRNHLEAQEHADALGDALLLAVRPAELQLEVLTRRSVDGREVPVVRARLNRVEWEMDALAALDVAGRLMILDADRSRQLPCVRETVWRLQRAATAARRLVNVSSLGRSH